MDVDDAPKVLELFLVESDSELASVGGMEGPEAELAVEEVGPVGAEAELAVEEVGPVEAKTALEGGPA